jgi:hypothetical protein
MWRYPRAIWRSSERVISHKKARRIGRAFLWLPDQELLDLGFLVLNVLANHRIVLFNSDFFRGVTLVLFGRVEVTSTC